MEDISPQAALLLRILKDFAKGKKYCWPGQERLAKLMNRSIRSIKRYTAELEALGLVCALRSGLTRTNRYIICDKGPTTSGLDRTSLSSLDRTSLSGLDRTSVSPYPSERPYSVEFKQEETKDSSKADAAAAAGKFLTEIGIPQSEFQEKEKSLVLAVVEHVQDRIAAPKKKPITLAYVISCLRRPAEKHGFKNTSEGWQKPAERNLAAMAATSEWKRKTELAHAALPAPANKSPPEDTMRRRLEKLHGKVVEAKIDQAAIAVREDETEWEALPDQERNSIIDYVKKNSPLFATTPASFRMLCYAEMRRRRRGGTSG